MTRILNQLRHVGPALILAAVVLGPGSITLATLAGGLYQYRLIWVIALATVFMVTYTLMAARLGLVTRKTLFDVTRTKFGKGFARLGGLFGFLSILAFQAGNSAAVGFSGDAFFGLGSRFWSVLFLIPALGLLLFPNLYARLELLVKCVVIVMIAGFVGTLFVVGVDIAGFVRGLRPGFPDGNSVFLSLGMVGTTFSIAAAAYQNYLMREKGWGVKDLSKEGLDSLIGIAILGGISMIILLTSARVINASNQEILSAQGMAVQLEPLFGRVAFYLFGCGFFFASFSSLIVNPLIGASLLVDGFGGSPSMENRTVRRWAATAMGVGVGVVLLFNGNPVELLRIAQALAVVAFPVLGFLVWSQASDRKIMGNFANGRILNTLAALGYMLILAIAFNYLRQIVASG